MYDGSKTKLPAVLARKSGENHPYVVGGDVVRRYLTVANECGQAAVAIVPQLTEGFGRFGFGRRRP